MDSNWVHGPSGQNGGATQKIVLEIGTVLMIADDSDFEGGMGNKSIGARGLKP
jgi:hypothetical protein